MLIIFCPKGPRTLTALMLAASFAVGSGCSTIRKTALRNFAGMLTSSGSANVFTEDDDPELIRDALPFALKTYESLLAADPENRELALATASGFVKYSKAFVQAEADRLEDQDLQRAKQLQMRAGRLYLRGRNYALRALSLDYPDFESRIRTDTQAVLGKLTAKDAPMLFWAAAGWGGAISTDISNMELVADVACVEAMMRRALALDESYQHGLIHEFFIAYEGSRSESMGGSPTRAREHFDRAVELTRGQAASPYVTLASSVAVRQQDYPMFKELLNKALAIDPDDVPEWRLNNILAQQKAAWLLGRSDKLFLDLGEEE